VELGTVGGVAVASFFNVEPTLELKKEDVEEPNEKPEAPKAG
jgi:hypothetical protein